MSGEAFVEAAGRRLKARRIGSWSSHEPVLVLLHEGLGSVTQWRDFPEALAEACGLPALLYDRYGHGGSEPLTGPRTPDFLRFEAVKVLPDVLAACHVGRPLLFGHSDGGTIALLHAATAATPPVAVVTEAAHVFAEPVTRAALTALRTRWAEDDDFRRRLARHHGEGTDAMVRGFVDTWLSPAMESWRMTDRLPAIHCPVLAIQGEDDEHGSRAQVEAIVSRVAGPACGLLVPACGHVPHRERPDVVCAHTTAFIARALAGEAPDAPGDILTADRGG